MGEKAPITIGGPSKGKEKVPEEAKAEIAVLGGTMNYSPELVKDAIPVKVFTPFGPTSDHIFVGWVKDRKVAFLARHGRYHTIVNYNLNYRANIWAMKELGVVRLISPYAVGTLHPEIVKPYHFMIFDDVIGQPTLGSRNSLSFSEGGEVIYVTMSGSGMSGPFCPELKKVIKETARRALPNVVIHPTPADEKLNKRMVCVTISGPRFSTVSESLIYKFLCDQTNAYGVLNMTCYSEIALCREAEICMAGIGLITDSDVYSALPVSAARVVKSMRENVKNVNKLLYEVIPTIPKERKCECVKTLDVALM